jgi:hypothetical protein
MKKSDKKEVKVAEKEAEKKVDKKTVKKEVEVGEDKVKVKAVWTVGYPAGENKKIYSDGQIFKADIKWAREQAREGKVEILEEAKAKTIDELLEMYKAEYGWYSIPGIEKNVRKEEAVEILKEKKG